MNFEDHLISQARDHIQLSRIASEEAKAFLDAGYPKKQARDKAVEELRNSIDLLIQATDLLASKIEHQQPRRRKLFRF